MARFFQSKHQAPRKSSPHPPALASKRPLKKLWASSPTVAMDSKGLNIPLVCSSWPPSRDGGWRKTGPCTVWVILPKSSRWRLIEPISRSPLIHNHLSATCWLKGRVCALKLFLNGSLARKTPGVSRHETLCFAAASESAEQQRHR